MEKPDSTRQAMIASLAGLIVLNCVMLAALFSQVAPHPPGRVGPYIGATTALAFVSLLLTLWGNRVGNICSIITGIMCLVAMGPHKLFIEKTAAQIAPVILLGSVLCVVLVVSSGMAWRGRQEGR